MFTMPVIGIVGALVIWLFIATRKIYELQRQNHRLRQYADDVDRHVASLEDEFNLSGDRHWVGLSEMECHWAEQEMRRTMHPSVHGLGE